MDAVAAEARETIAAGSKSFATAARLFPPQLRDRASMLYAWCRYCDDVIDGQTLGFAADEPAERSPEARLAELRRRTQAVYAGEEPEDPVFRAFQRVVIEANIPETEALDLLAGFEMDVAGHRYETLADTLLYSYHVAGVVGVMMARVMGAHEPPTLDRACDLGLAFQLTNMARDVIDDAHMGRCYLPRQWLAEAGVPPEELLEHRHRPALAGLAGRLVDTAEPYYRSALAGLPALPLRSAWAIAAARTVYRDIGRKVQRRGSAAWDSRTSTGPARKATVLVTSLGRALNAHSLARLRTPPSREGLWTRPRRD